jgi:PD-(D/E)XK nuclease superfamily
MRDPQTYEIIGAAMEAHRVLGCGFLEPVYREALAKEFVLRGIPFPRQVDLPITYKGSRTQSIGQCGHARSVRVPLGVTSYAAGHGSSQITSSFKPGWSRLEGSIRKRASLRPDERPPSDREGDSKYDQYQDNQNCGSDKSLPPPSHNSSNSKLKIFGL